MTKIKWIIAHENKTLRDYFACQFSVDPIIAQLLINRGLQNEKEVKNFLYPDLQNLLNPFSFPGMERAVERIKKAFSKGERILIYGDYDVDGMTSTALLFSALNRFATDLYYYIPDRSEEGYGISQKGIQFAHQSHISLVITVDCGITSHQEIQQLNDLGIDVLVTDHHEPIEKLPPAFSVINPKSSDYPFKELAGVGVVFKLIQALYISLGEREESGYEHLDLVALGTIADSVPILGENRILVKFGLDRLIKSSKKGLKCLLKHYNQENLMHPLLIQDISFGLIPILNSTGRIGNPYHTIDLLLTDSSYRAQFIMDEMLRVNEERRAVTQQVLEEARQAVVENEESRKQKILILSSHNWHPGVIGIVANRMMEEFLKPVIMISVKDGIGKGSGRNQGEFDFSKILNDCSDLLMRYGGHQFAAGITIHEENIVSFRKRINQIVEQPPFHHSITESGIHVDSIIALDKINWDFVNDLERLRPFGPGNLQPLFGSYSFPLVSWKRVGKNDRHLKLTLGKQENSYDGIAFQMAEKSLNVMKEGIIDLAFHLNINYWNGRKSIQLMVKDIKSSLRRLEQNGSEKQDKKYTGFSG